MYFVNKDKFVICTTFMYLYKVVNINKMNFEISVDAAYIVC